MDKRAVKFFFRVEDSIENKDGVEKFLAHSSSVATRSRFIFFAEELLDNFLTMRENFERTIEEIGKFSLSREILPCFFFFFASRF